MRNIVVIVDSDAIISLVNPADANKQRAAYILTKFQQMKANLYFPATTIVEAITTCQRTLSSPVLTNAMFDKVKRHELSILQVDEEVIALATSLFSPDGSKQNTFFDAVVAAMARQYKADAIFSFDKWYIKIGLTNAEDYLEAFIR